MVSDPQIRPTFAHYTCSTPSASSVPPIAARCKPLKPVIKEVICRQIGDRSPDVGGVGAPTAGGLAVRHTPWIARHQLVRTKYQDDSHPWISNIDSPVPPMISRESTMSHSTVCVGGVSLLHRPYTRYSIDEYPLLGHSCRCHPQYTRVGC